MPDNIYAVNWGKLGAYLLPKMLTNLFVVSWLKSAFYPLVMLHNDFMNYRRSTNYRLSINFQVCSLERLLNDRYDYVQRRITIDDVESKEPVYFAHRLEVKPVYFSTRAEAKPIYFPTRGEIGAATFDAVIKVPAGIVFSNVELLSLVKNYCLPAKKIKVQIV